MQTCRNQVVGALESFMSNRGNEFKDAVLSCDFDADTKIALLFLNKYKAWYRKSVTMQGVAIPAETMRLARNIMRGILKRHRKPNLCRANMALDHKVAMIERATKPGKFDWWLRLSTLQSGKRLCLPLRTNTWFEGLPGKWKNFAQVNLSASGEVTVGRLKDIPATHYKPAVDVLGLDVGITTLLATSEGDLLGRGFQAKLVKLDRQISALAANRQRMGLKARSPRYDRLVRRMRDFVKNEIHRTLRGAILRHRPRMVAVERLDFRSPELSRRMNRLVQNFGRRAFPPTPAFGRT